MSRSLIHSYCIIQQLCKKERQFPHNRKKPLSRALPKARKRRVEPDTVLHPLPFLPSLKCDARTWTLTHSTVRPLVFSMALHRVLHFLGHIDDGVAVFDQEGDVHPDALLLHRDVDALGQVLLAPSSSAISLPRLAARLPTPSTSMAAAAAITASTSSEIWILPSSSGRETYSFPSPFRSRSFFYYVFIVPQNRKITTGFSELPPLSLCLNDFYDWPQAGLVGDNLGDSGHIGVGKPSSWPRPPR